MYHRKLICLISITALLLLLLTTCAQAQHLDPSKKISQYLVKNWQTKDGLPQNSVISIIQTADGYMWFGTYEGLVRFNGKKFTEFSSKNCPLFNSNRIVALCEDTDHTLFIATAKSILRYKAGSFSTVEFRKKSDNEFVMNGQMLRDKYGSIWALTDANRLYRYKNGCFSELVFENEKPFKGKFYNMVRGGDSLIYLNGWDELYCLQPNQTVSYSYSRLINGERVYGIAGDPEGGILVMGKNLACTFPGRSIKTTNMNLDHDNFFFVDYNGAVWAQTPYLTRFSKSGTEISTITSSVGQSIIVCSFIDREGNIWVGSDGAGLFRISEPKVTFISRAEGLHGDVVWSVCEDKYGNICGSSMQSIVSVITAAGITETDLKPPADRMSFNSVYPLKRGGLAATCSKLFIIDSAGRINNYTPAAGIKNLQAIYEDETENLWVGSVRDGMYHFGKNGMFKLDKKDGILHGYVSAITGDVNGNIWAGSRGGLQRIYRGRVAQSFTVKDGLSDNWVRTIFIDKSGTLWAGTDYGLNKIVNNKITSYTTAQGLYNNVFHAILEDNSGRLWFSCNTGIYSIEKKQFDLLDSQKINRLHYRLFTYEDGLKSEEGNGSTQPAGWKTRDGKLLFAMSKGIAIIAPDHIPVNQAAPHVVIESITVDDSLLSTEASGIKYTLSSGNHNLSFSFAALSFTNPARNTYRVYLKGFDNGPKNIGDNMEISYTNIPAGEYTFVVMAANNDGVWSRDTAIVQFIIPKPYYLTLWFQIPAALLLFAIVWYSASRFSQIQSRRRVRQMEQEIKLERERARISRDIHDEVGSSLTKISILSELAIRHSSDHEKLHSNLKKISGLSRQAISNVSEIVWAMNPRNDNLENFAAYIREHVQQELEDSGIGCVFYFPDEVPSIAFSSDNRRNLFLIIKEIVNNCIKHSGAVRMVVSLEIIDGGINLRFIDNGAGFNSDDIHASGNGLRNMKERASLMGAKLTIKPAEGGGTEITIICPNTTFI